MTRISTDRKPLDDAQGDEDGTVMVLKGSAGAVTGDIHDTAEQGVKKQTWRYVLLVEKFEELEKDERDWFGADDDYVILRGMPKEVRVHGPKEDLLSKGGQPAITRIRGKFAEADAR